MSKLQLLLIHFLLFTVFGHLPAQEYIVNVQQYGIEDGLAHRDILDIFKDSYGFLWLTTNQGVQRFDGYNFKFYAITDKDGNEVRVTQIGQDKNGYLWLLSSNSLTFLHPLTGKIIDSEEYIGKKNATVFEKIIAKTSYGLSYNPHYPNRFYIGHENEIIIFDVDAEERVRKLMIPSFKNIYIHLVDRKGNIWITGEGTALTKLSATGEILGSYEKSHQPYFLILKSNVFEWKSRTYFLLQAPAVNQQQFCTLNDTSHQKEVLFTLAQGVLPTNFINGFLWCISPEGWKVYDVTGKLSFELNREDYEEKLFEGLNYKKIITDKNNHFYLNSEFGLNIIEVQKNPFTQYFSNTAPTPLPVNNAARGIIATKDSLTVNFEYGGLLRFPKKEPKAYRIISDWVSLLHGPKVDYNGRPIITSQNDGFYTGHINYIFKWEDDFLKKERISLPKDLQRYGQVCWTIWESDKGCIYAPFTSGLIKYCPTEQSYSFDSYLEIGANLEEITHYQLRPEGQDLLWMCSDKGLFSFDIKEHKVSHRYYKGGEGEYALPCEQVYFLHIDQDNNKWLGTNKGLLFWNTQTGEKRLFNRNDGLSNEVIYAIFEDKQNRLWLSSDYGIMSFHKETFKVQTYLPKDGVAQEEFNRISHFQETDGTIYFGGLNGVTAFHPDDFSLEEDSYAKLLITEYEIFDGTAGQLLNKMDDLIHTNIITFHPDDKYFKLQFVLPIFDDISKNRYAWKIEGVYDNWTYQKENSLQLAALPYGKYVLQIKGQGAKGGWSPHELKINILITKPFYLKIWFFILCFLVLGIGIWSYNHYRMQRFNTRQEQLQKVVYSATTKINEDKKTIEKQAEELRQLDKMKSRFFANVSHELRTPLTLILGPINSAIKSGTLSNRNFTHLLKAKQSGKDLLKLVASILDLSKMESGKLEVYEKPILLFNLLRRIASTFESHAQRSGIELSFLYQAEKSLQLKLDEEKIETILNNLLSNAIKFTPTDGKIIVKTEDKGNAILLSVKDTGRGIHPDDLPKVFDRFYQTKQKNAPTEGGTGIGLALCQELVKIMGGKIWVESTLGKGSTFFVQVNRVEVLGVAENEPLVTEVLKTPDAVAEKEVSDIKSATKKEHHLLIVEDNHELRSYIKSILSPYYNITTAENGQDALDDGLKKEDYQLIISDIMMPVMDGFQLLEKLKSSDKYRHIPVIMLTARADMQDKLKALRIGVDDYLLKPFEEEELLVRIENLLDSRENRKTFLSENNTAVEDESPSLSANDQLWLESYEVALKKQLNNSSYSITQMATDNAMSVSTLTRQLRRLTGLTPARYFQAIRLNEARQLLESKSFKTITEVAYQVGFSDVTAFNRAFKRHYGKSPSEI